MKTQGRRSQYWKLGTISFLTICIAISCENFAFAQLSPDLTLESESSVVTPLNPSVEQIDGGAIRGANLFHSFQEFNVGEKREVYFTNPSGVENILSRVTGNNPSKIFGKLGVVGGNANLFLINPNGIIFGAKASLDVRGSFAATTANAVGFGNQGVFSASTPNAPPVLTVNPSALLFNQLATGSITNNSKAPAGQRLDPTLIDRSRVRNLFGLRVPDGKSLLLVGGNVSLDGGELNALGGQIELGGVLGAGAVELNINDNDLSLNFPNEVARADVFFTNGARVDSSGEGGGSIQVQGRHITLTQGSQIITNTLGSKPGGTLTVTASDSVNLTGFTPGGILSTRTWSTGQGGDLTINTKSLTVQDGAQILTTTNDIGSAGKLTANASESIELTGTTSDRRRVPSSLLSLTAAAGNAGDLTINTRRLLIRDGAGLSTESSGSSVAGNFLPATGRGSNLTVNASQSAELKNDSFISSITQGSANAGDITINTGKLLIQDEAEVTVSSESTGDAGNLQVQADSIHLENSGKLTATTKTGRGGGNINLQNSNLLLLRRNGEISTSATGEGNGGNISVDTETLVAAENSNITANAERGKGGNIHITTQGLFVSPDSSISAASERGIDGVVEIRRPDVDPSTDLVILPTQVVDISSLVAQGCPAGGSNSAAGQSQFVIAGRGGLPPTPAEVTRSDSVLADLGTPVQSQEKLTSATIPSNPTPAESAPLLVEANGWAIGSKGEVVLTVSSPSATPDIPWLKPTSCHSS